MKRLAGITLMNSIEMETAYQSAGVSTVHRVALDGSLVTFSGPALRQIVLRAGDDYGWVRAEDAEALVLLSQTTTSTTLEWLGAAIPVRWDHSSGPAVQLSPLYPGAQWCAGTIALIRED